jgi:hypothetical protein
LTRRDDDRRVRDQARKMSAPARFTSRQIRSEDDMNPYWVVVAFTILAQFTLFVRWLHRRMRDDEIRRTFVTAMARMHLPHLYHALHEIADHLGIHLEEPPAIGFIDLTDPKHRE